MTKQYNLVITPALPAEVRHKIEDALKALGFHVSGGGAFTDGSSCDISFEEE